VSYGLRFAGLGDSGEVVSGLFGQSYRFFGDTSDLDASSGIDDDFSDYVGRIDFAPDPAFRVRYRFRLDQDDLTPTRNELGAVVGPSRVRVGVTYLSLEDDPTVERGRKREEITAGVVLRVLPSLALRAQFRRNLQQERDIWHKYGFVYRHPCLELVGGVERRFTENADAEEDITFSVRVSFTNLGSLSAESGMLGPLSSSR
jgi:LPS-assembly protein